MHGLHTNQHNIANLIQMNQTIKITLFKKTHEHIMHEKKGLGFKNLLLLEQWFLSHVMILQHSKCTYCCNKQQCVQSKKIKYKHLDNQIQMGYQFIPKVTFYEINI